MGTTDNSTPAPEDSLLGVACKLALICAFFAVWMFVYKWLNNWGADPVRAIRLTRPYDVWPGVIQPWTAVLYIFAGYFIPFLPFLWNWSWPRLNFVLATYLVSSIIAFTCYWLFPLAIQRPPFEGDGIGEWLMRGVVAVDNDANCCPSFHTSFAILAALLVARGGAPVSVQVVVWVLAVGICITTVTTGQHYCIDVPGGIASAVVSFYGVAWLCDR